jgi:hypothetical protein
MVLPKLLIDKVMGVESVGFDIPVRMSLTKNILILNTLTDKVKDTPHGNSGIRVRNLVMHGNVCYYLYLNLYLQQNHLFISYVFSKSKHKMETDETRSLFDRHTLFSQILESEIRKSPKYKSIEFVFKHFVAEAYLIMSLKYIYFKLKYVYFKLMIIIFDNKQLHLGNKL